MATGLKVPQQNLADFFLSHIFGKTCDSQFCLIQNYPPTPAYPNVLILLVPTNNHSPTTKNYGVLSKSYTWNGQSLCTPRTPPLPRACFCAPTMWSIVHNKAVIAPHIHGGNY